MEDHKNDADFIEEMETILDPFKGLEIGHDDFVYGSYVEWPLLDSCDDDQLILLLRYFGVEIPFGETRSVEELDADAFGVDFDIVGNIDSATREVSLRTLDEAKPEILEYLRSKGVPEGTVYEHDMDKGYPDHMRHLTSRYLWDDQEMDYYTQTPITLIEYLRHINEVKVAVAKADDSLTKCALILSALIYAECYVKSTITNMLNSALPQISGVLDEGTFKSHVNKQMRTTAGREFLYRLLFSGRKPAKPPCTDIRNSLAHSIDAAECKMENGEEILFYPVLSNGGESIEIKSLEVEKIFNKLSNFRLPDHEKDESGTAIEF